MAQAQLTAGSLSWRDNRNFILTQGLSNSRAHVDAVVHELPKLRSLGIILSTNDIDRRSLRILFGLFSITVQEICLEESGTTQPPWIGFLDETHGPPTEVMSASKYGEMIRSAIKEGFQEWVLIVHPVPDLYEAPQTWRFQCLEKT